MSQLAPLPQPEPRSSRYIEYPSVCRIVLSNGDKGSGVLVAKSNSAGYVLTARHVVDSMAAITVAFPSEPGREYQGTVEPVPVAGDVAVIRLRGVPSVQETPLSDKSLARGELLTVCGFGGYPTTGFKSRMAVFSYQSNEYEGWISGASRKGDSGGPVFDSDMRVVGVVRGNDQEYPQWSKETCMTYGRPWTPIRNMLSSIGCCPQPRPIPQRPIPNTPQAIAQGPKGDPGPQGPKGDKGDKGDPGQLTEAHIAAMTAAILQTLQTNEEFIANVKGPKGDPGEPVDLVAIREIVEDVLRDKGFTARLFKEGQLVDEEFIPLGGILDIHHNPIQKK